MPVTFFLLGAIIASAGPGNISTAAMLGPMAMTVASRASIPPFLMAIMVGNGAQAGALSPVAPTGLIVSKLMTEKVGLPGHELETYLANLVAHAIVAFGGYLLFGGWKLFGSSFTDEAVDRNQLRFERMHWITLGVIAVVLIPVLTLKAHIGMAAFAGATILAALNVADHEQAIRRMPWTPIIMVCGVSVLVGLLEKTGGLDLFSSMLARFATEGTLAAFVAFVTALISVYSSTSSVVLPAFLPTVPRLVMLVGGDPLSVATSMNVAAHLVDMSPLSTTGAVCIAAIADPAQVRPTYNKLLAWGLSMTVVGTLGVYLFSLIF
jgi:di/tricarboxylate transporter